MDSLISFFSYTQTQYVEKIFSLLGKGKRHAKGLYAEKYQKGFWDLYSSWIEPQARPLVEEMISITDTSLPPVSSVTEEENVVKFLLRYSDGLESESVILPMKFATTLCISSQVGCRMGCAFCETGKMGLIRSLKASEIVSQVYTAKFLFKANVRNLVFMGMGEPFDNYEEVMQAIRVLTCPQGLSIAPSKITVSTSGKVQEMYRFAKEADPSINLAVSLNAPNDFIRSKWMPVNKDWDLQELKKAMEFYLLHPRRKILIEYVLIQGVNDSVEDALQVAKYLQGLRVKINLIPYNTQSKGRIQPPSEETVQAFRNVLKQEGYSVLVRATKGRSIMAACGQLGNQDLKKKLGAKSSLSLL